MIRIGSLIQPYKTHINPKKMNEVELLFLNKSMEKAGIFLYNKSDSLQFIEECRRRKVTVLGIDGFKISEDGNHPLIEDSIDISLYPFDEGSYEMLLDFLTKRDDHIFFEIVCL